MINVYGDKFTLITNDALTNRINLSAKYINMYGYNPDVQVNLSKWNGKDNLYENKSTKIINIISDNNISDLYGDNYLSSSDSSIITNILKPPIFNRKDFLESI